jgi:phosphatidylglycerophosphatase A
VRNWLTKCIATGLFSGYSPSVPGTVGTIPAWLVAFFLVREQQIVLAAVTIVTFLVSVRVASAAETIFGHDSKKIVIDEWAGMFVALVLVPYSLSNYLIAFVAFRVFDVLKIPPAAQAEKLPGGWGVTMDDIVAGVQANILTQVVVMASGYL